MMTPSLIIVGATDTTSRGVAETFSKHLETSHCFSGYWILALTRSSSSLVAQQLAKLPNVEEEEHY